jgi:signal transduction histidine kinase
MREAVRYERRVEFPVEAVNFFDEVRWGTYKETKSPGLRRGGVHTPEPADNPEGRQPETKPFHIMVVEATPDLREFLVKNFEDTYGVLSAKNGAEALAILEKQACDLIISDALMPEMDGFDLLMKVRNDEMLCHIPFILLSVVDSVDSKIKGLEYGADVYIEKPFSLGYVKATVESLLENRKRAFRHFASRPGFQYEKDDMGRNDRQWLDKLTGIVRENLTCETLSVDLLTEKMALSRSSLQRKLKGLTGVSPNEYIQLVRLKTAAQLLRSGEYRISEVCYLTGFSSMSWFAKCFTKQFGMRPKDFIRQNQDGKSSG